MFLRTKIAGSLDDLEYNLLLLVASNGRGLGGCLQPVQEPALQMIQHCPSAFSKNCRIMKHIRDAIAQLTGS
jgi:hypothetical protein